MNIFIPSCQRHTEEAVARGLDLGMWARAITERLVSVSDIEERMQHALHDMAAVVLSEPICCRLGDDVLREVAHSVEHCMKVRKISRDN